MKITKVCCQGCGADLEVDESIRYVTCNYCHARLEVVHDSSVTHTRQLDKIVKTTDELAGKLKLIELQNDLELLDRDWESRRESLLVRNKNGSVSEPSSAGSIVMGIIMIAFGIFWLGMTSSAGAPAFFPLFGFIFIGIAIFSMIKGTSNAGEFMSSKERYETRRNQLLRQIAEQRNS